jgi:hypothetical protein
VGNGKKNFMSIDKDLAYSLGQPMSGTWIIAHSLF